MTSQEKSESKARLEQELRELPRGKVFYKRIKGKEQPYLQWSENGKAMTKYVKVAERERIFSQLERRADLEKELAALQAASQAERAWNTPAVMMESAGVPEERFRMNVVLGGSLEDLISGVRDYHRRDCYGKLRRYMQSRTYGKVCILYGLRRTGKTTLLFQLIGDLSPEDRRKAVYVKARVTDHMADLSADLRTLRAHGFQYAFLDEVTLMEDFIDTASILSDLYAMQGMKIVLSGTDSLGFWMAEGNELYDRAYMIHTTYIPFREYSRLLGIDDIDEYIRYGGTLMPGETAFDDPDALDETAAFRDDESTRRYIDTAVCRNIQHSLACFQNGTHFRHLINLYDADELTGAINRLIESMNHQFLLRTLISRFRSHDYGSAAQMLQKQTDPKKRTDILERVDREAITRKLMEMLEIRNREDQKVGIVKEHVAEMKEYLKALDLVIDCPAETTIPGAAPTEYVLFTQPGMRYSQAQGLVHILMKDPVFQSFSEWEKKLAGDKILEDVRGRMMEDIVLMDTARSLSMGRRAFKLYLSRREVDMAIYDTQAHCCEIYEVKHSGERTPEQIRTLMDEELSQEVEAKYGQIARKCVIYRGQSIPGDSREDGVEYRNVEEYLKSL